MSSNGVSTQRDDAPAHGLGSARRLVGVDSSSSLDGHTHDDADSDHASVHSKGSRGGGGGRRLGLRRQSSTSMIVAVSRARSLYHGCCGALDHAVAVVTATWLYVVVAAVMGRLCGLCDRVVRSVVYDKFIVLCIVFNAVSIGIERNNMPPEQLQVTTVLEVVFASVFTFGPSPPLDTRAIAHPTITHSQRRRITPHHTATQHNPTTHTTPHHAAPQHPASFAMHHTTHIARPPSSA